MSQEMNTLERRTSADDVFDYLLAQINSLQLLPGTRISEVEISRKFDVSRQPVREAFIRLANRGLLLVRPQKATIVRRFSMQKILRARFIRHSIECEVLRRACRTPLGPLEGELETCIDTQRQTIERGDIEAFHALDYDFHQILCDAAQSGFVFETIAENKAQVDRMCMLSLNQPAAMNDLLEDHVDIRDGLVAQDETTVIDAIIRHLSRLDDTVAAIRQSHADYFED